MENTFSFSSNFDISPCNGKPCGEPTFWVTKNGVEYGCSNTYSNTSYLNTNIPILVLLSCCLLFDNLNFFNIIKKPVNLIKSMIIKEEKINKKLEKNLKKEIEKDFELEN